MTLKKKKGNDFLIEKKTHTHFFFYKYKYIANEAVNCIKQLDRGDQLTGVPREFIIADVYDHYRTYSLIEPYMYTPIKLLEQSCFQLTTNARRQIIEK